MQVVARRRREIRHSVRPLFVVMDAHEHEHYELVS